MTRTRFPLEGHPHLFLAAQDDDVLLEKIKAGLRTAGFAVKPDRLIPPVGAQSPDIIAAMTAAFQNAKGNS